VSYNVHQWTGTDGVIAPQRVVKVLKELNADIIGLQETNFSHNGKGFRIQDLAAEMGMKVVTGATLQFENGNYGNVLLTNHPVIRVRRINLSVHTREPRGALDVDLNFNGSTVRIIVTHLGLRAFERRAQVAVLMDSISIGHSDRTIILGDFNFWSPVSIAERQLTNRFGKSPALRTYPARFPMFPLDRIWVNPNKALVETAVHTSPVSKIASDHLPIKATIRFGFSST
jgi:endonuclease/exonuclease/phosphatase family metal-dependent hydrolase